MSFINFLTTVLFSLAAFMFLKNHLVYKARLKTLARISERAKQAIDDRDFNWQRFYDLMDKPSYNVLMWNPTVWTYRQMYPHINEQLK